MLTPLIYYNGHVKVQCYLHKKNVYQIHNLLSVYVTRITISYLTHALAVLDEYEALIRDINIQQLVIVYSLHTS